MIAFERVKKLSESRGKNLKQVAADLELGENYFYSWKKSSPKADTLEKVANYFNVSTDYILGRTDNTSSEEEQSITKQVMMRMNTDGLSEKEIDEIESEMERFFSWRIKEIKRERGE